MSENNQEIYTVSELADLIGVPRTTINDWLTRYQQYADFSFRGKRKVYTPRTLQLLREVAEARGRELSSFEIEEKLALNHPLQGEVARPEEPQPPPPPAEPQAQRQEDPAAEGTGTDLVARQQAREVFEIINSKFDEINRRLEELRSAGEQPKPRAWGWPVLAAAALVALAVLALVAAVAFNKLTKFQEALGSEQVRTERLGQELEAKEQAHQRELAAKAKELQERELRRSAEELRLREQFAGEKLELLKRVETEADDGKRKAALLAELVKRSEEQNKIIMELSARQTVDSPVVEAKPVPPPATGVDSLVFEPK